MRESFCSLTDKIYSIFLYFQLVEREMHDIGCACLRGNGESKHEQSWKGQQTNKQGIFFDCFVVLAVSLASFESHYCPRN